MARMLDDQVDGRENQTRQWQVKARTRTRLGEDEADQGKYQTD
jgi:hypothetical protein